MDRLSQAEARLTRFIEVTEQGKCYEYGGKNDADYCASFHPGATSISGNHNSMPGVPDSIRFAKYYHTAGDS